MVLRTVALVATCRLRVCGSEIRLEVLTCDAVHLPLGLRRDDRGHEPSLAYHLLRQIVQMLTQLARDGGATDIELLVLRPPS